MSIKATWNKKKQNKIEVTKPRKKFKGMNTFISVQVCMYNSISNIVVNKMLVIGKKVVNYRNKKNKENKYKHKK